jgi:hypothetical protein
MHVHKLYTVTYPSLYFLPLSPQSQLASPLKSDIRETNNHKITVYINKAKAPRITAIITPIPPLELLAAPVNVVGTADFVAAAPAAVLVVDCFSKTKLTLGRPVPNGLLDAEPVGYGATVGTTVAVDLIMTIVLYRVVVRLLVVWLMLLDDDATTSAFTPPLETAFTGAEVASATGQTVV